MDDYGPNRYIKRRQMAVRKTSMTPSKLVEVAVIWLIAGTVFSAYMWALEYVGRLYQQLN